MKAKHLWAYNIGGKVNRIAVTDVGSAYNHGNGRVHKSGLDDDDHDSPKGTERSVRAIRGCTTVSAIR